MSSVSLALTPEQRQQLWTNLTSIVEEHLQRVEELPVAPVLNSAALRAELESLTFEEPLEPASALEFVADGLRAHQVHTSHPRYFGLFNPAPSVMGIAADTLVAAFNPQIAAWSHSPFAAEAERRLIRLFGAGFGYPLDQIDGTFASGGAEANHTAVCCALAHAFPEWRERGLREVSRQPVLYLTGEAHHSVLKAARLCGLGEVSVRTVATDASLGMDVAALQSAIHADREAGLAPFLIVATAGTTNAGVIDPVAEIAGVAKEQGIWLHADAAWGGAVSLVPELRALLAGIAEADSITFDCHKWLSVPMGAGLFLTRRTGVMRDAFGTAVAYMPKEAESLDVVDPFTHTMQWSRRFIGCKVLMTLLVAGLAGYRRIIARQVEMGVRLRERLAAEGWTIVNQSPLPVVCFRDPASPVSEQEVVNRVVRSGRAWISTTRCAGFPVVRACITHFGTTEADVEALVEVLGRARAGADLVRRHDSVITPVPV